MIKSSQDKSSQNQKRKFLFKLIYCKLFHAKHDDVYNIEAAIANMNDELN